jgi:hypothetical protein
MLAYDPRRNPFAFNDEPLENNDEDASTNDTLLIKPVHVNEKIFTNVWGVTITTAFIMAVLLGGLINLNKSAEIIYGIIGFYTFQVYYIIHICWYASFFIIHLFLVSTQLFYTMNKRNYINYIIINYKQISYNIYIKFLFMSSIIVILFLQVDNTSPIPLYYNLIIIEIVLSTLLLTYINDVINAYNQIV